MTNRPTLLIVLNLLIFNFGLLVITYKSTLSEKNVPPVLVVPNLQAPEEPPINYKLKTPIPNYLNYHEMVGQLQEWVHETPQLSEIGVYGKSSLGNDLVYFRIHKNPNKPVVLITSAIHGNESWSTGVVMGYIGVILDQYGDDEQITEIVNTTDLYFIPIISPDSYPNRRETDGVDPNRNFPTLQEPNRVSVQSVQALREFFLSLRPAAVISGHTWGRMYLQPYGDTMKDPPHHVDYQRIVGKMAEMSQYTLQKASQIYRRPISGSEVDWYYRRGAFAIVAEYGTHQHPPSETEIISEFNRTFQAFLYFLQEAPKVKVDTSVSWVRAA